MPTRTKKLKLESLGLILARTFKKRKIEPDQGKSRLKGIWERAAGPQISAQTSPEFLKNDTIFVKVSSSVWLHQLQFLKEDILEKLAPLITEIELKNIHFSLGMAAPASKSPKGGNNLPLDLRYLKERDKKMIDECQASLKDRELAEIFRRAMTREIVRRRIIESQGRGKT
ncbi:MAG: DUF721 domain-containing protein [Smithellaceae bacterium]|nr:DUF721 domain-containing protein [Smithellaceae bacterium]